MIAYELTQETRSMEKFDAIIIGAGPAGSTAAKYIADNNLNVLILEKDAFPRDKPCAGGLCHHINSFPHIQEFMKKQKSLIQSTCRGSTIFYPPRKQAYSYSSPSDLFYTIFRTDFDNELLKLAISSGAQIKTSCRIKKVMTTNDHVQIQLQDDTTFSTPILLCADGAHGKVGSMIRKELGVEEQWKKSISIGLLEELAVDPEFIQQTYGSNRKAVVFFKWGGLKGYAWVFPKRNTVNIGYAIPMKRIKTYDVHELFSTFLDFLKERHLLSSSIESTNLRSGLIPLEGPLQKTYTSRKLLLGDAAGFVSPLSGEGIFFAMDSARIAADVVIQGHQTKEYSQRLLKSYHTRCMNTWGKDLKMLVIFRDILMRFPYVFLKAAYHNIPLQQCYAQLFNGNLSALDALPIIIKQLPKSSKLRL